jgi:tricorn protease
MFVYGGDNRTPIDNVSLGFLGASMTRDTSVGGYRVDKVYRGEPDYPKSWSPLAKSTANVVAGDIILAVNGHDSLEGSDIQELLRNQAGKQVLLHIKEGSTGTVRDCIVRPISAGEDFNLRYTDWEVSRRQMVDDKSSRQIGYVHLRAMGSGDIAQWERDFYPVFDRPGLIIDVRHNNGGNIDSWIIEKMLRKAWFYWQPRLGKPYWNMQWAFRGHVVVLCDQHTASDGEAFTEGMKRLGLAKVIGKRTWGGEVWLSSDNGLVDNGIATAAEYGVFGPEGKWLIEGHGVDPDFEVDNLPHATYLGQDAQLEAALQYLSQQIKSSPVSLPSVPAYPNKKWPPK